MQTLGQLKKKIYMSLDAYSHNGKLPDFAGNILEDTEIRINTAIDSVLKKIVAACRGLVKISAIPSLRDESLGYEYIALPADFMAVKAIKSKAKKAVCDFEYHILQKRLVSYDMPSGEYILIYYAFPPTIDEDSDDDLPLDFDDYILDTAVFGAAMELCLSLYPSDAGKYMRLATEYDERMANLYRDNMNAAGGAYPKTIFSAKKRGII